VYTKILICCNPTQFSVFVCYMKPNNPNALSVSRQFIQRSAIFRSYVYAVKTHCNACALNIWHAIRNLYNNHFKWPQCFLRRFSYHSYM